MIQKKTLSLCLPCRNEGAHLREVVARVPKEVDEILIISNKSSDGTVKIAKAIKDKRIKVLEDDRTKGGIGYGYAHMTGIAAASGDIIIGADGDATYPIEDIGVIAKYMLKHEIDFVSCNRYPLQDGTTIPFKLRLGVNLLNWEIRLLYGKKVQDTLSGMWLFRKDIRDDLHLTMGDWNLSPQIKLNAMRNQKIKFEEYSIAQHQRLGETKQNYFKTGLGHALWILKNRFRQQIFLGPANRSSKPGGGKISRWQPFLLTSVVLFAASGLKLWLVNGQHFVLNGNNTYDDLFFVRLANNIVHTGWLGPYNNLTLAKGPFYPLFMAGNYFAGLPLLLSEQILYLIACFAALFSISPLIKIGNAWWKYGLVCLLGLLLIFNPMTTDLQVIRVIREGIYPALTLLTISLFIALYAYRQSRLFFHALLGIMAGIVLSALWLTREEGYWILPFAVGATLYTALIIFRQRAVLGRCWARLVVLLLPFLILWTSVFSVSAYNHQKYGVDAVVEFKTPQFVAAYSSLTRVRAGNWLPVIPVSKAQRLQIYKVSPEFRKLKPYLEGDTGLAWAHSSEAVYPQYPGEIAGGWFMWAFRDAVQQAGYYKNGQTAMRYYATLASQVTAACSRHELRCVASTNNMYPPLNTHYIKPFLADFQHSLPFVWSFQQYYPFPLPPAGDAQSINLMATITHEPATVHYDPSRVTFLKRIASVYQDGFPLLTWVAIAIFAAFLLFKGSYRNAMFIFAGLVAGTIIVRAALLSLISVTSFPAINILYFSCVYPLLIIFDALCLYMLGAGIAARRASANRANS